MKNQIVITFKTNDEERNIYKNYFEERAKIVYLKDFPEDRHAEIISGSDIMIAWFTQRELNGIEASAFRSLKFLQLLSAGYDHLNFNLFPKDCVIASNVGAYSEPMAEHTVAMILSLAKHLNANHKKMSDGIFDQKTSSLSLRGSICGIIGFGSIGKAAAALLRNFGMKIFGINTSGKTEDNVDFIGTLKDLNYVLKSSDVVIISLPLNEMTENLIGKNEFLLMKENAVLVNVARGAIINQKDLYEHLKSHPGFSAGIDAWWSEPLLSGEFKVEYPFFNLPNFLGSPHNSAIIPGIMIEGNKKTAENVFRYLNGEPVRGLVKRF